MHAYKIKINMSKRTIKNPCVSQSTSKVFFSKICPD